MRTTLHPLIATLLVAPVLAACGSTGSPHVAALPAGVSSGTTTSESAGTVERTGTSDSDGADGSPGRPQFRLDDTDARRTALINAYSQCLIDHGATRLTGRESSAPQIVPAGGDGVPFITVADPVPTAAKAACASRLPLMPPQVEAATNPHFHEQSLAYVGCLRKHGEWVELLNNHDLDWTYAEGHPVPEDNAAIEQACLMEAFS
ncbi:hypothetical protein P5P86_05305 [Nocardioides sp. BP30]|uniref:hypothetical protein n=1 Tax=Nocardioides sp. BP30 TaxID=3036374 RepID=UPI0024682F3A|nr:hypothetical protein [Nocardioides sp. BP30]WGL53242.1 hypothetical protein P5P86_05305 [Nocardioides sp. BP30]